MNFTIIDAQGISQKHISASSLEQACELWAKQTWQDSVAAEAVVKASRFDLSNGARAAFLEPYLVTPAGTEQECIAKNEQRLVTDPHSAPDPALSAKPRTIDTGGRG